MKKFFIFILLGSAIITLSACGKAAKPSPYPESGYPHTYPYNR